MKILRTPDSQFANLPDYDFEPTYTTIRDEDGTDIRIHAVDIGPRDADPILLMHGNPSWAYVWRHVIRELLPTGRRIIAVDLVGCGRSDKPAKRRDYTLARHHDWMCKWLIVNDLKNVTLVCQDWGGTLGLKMVAEHPDRFDRVLATNTGLPIGEGGNNMLRWWLRLMKLAVRFPWKLAFMKGFPAKPPTEAELAAYRAPFPSAKYEAGILKFPQLIAIFPGNPGVEANLAAWNKLGTFKKPFLCIFGARDPVAKHYFQPLQDHIPGSQGQPHTRLDGIGHFSQHEAPEELSDYIKKFISA